jgi:ribose transport system substrate-binding protein
MLKSRVLTATLLASAAAFGLSIVAAQADDAADMQAAKDYIAKAAAPVTDWTGPTTGPKAQGKKLIVYVSADQRNGGASGVGDGAAEAAKAIGWDFRILDGQGSVPARTSALTQAIALKPDGIILGTVDAAEQAPMVEQAVAAGIKVVGWHSGAAPGPIDGVPGVFTNITTDPL